MMGYKVTDITGKVHTIKDATGWKGIADNTMIEFTADNGKYTRGIFVVANIVKFDVER